MLPYGSLTHSRHGILGGTDRRHRACCHGEGKWQRGHNHLFLKQVSTMAHANIGTVFTEAHCGVHHHIWHLFVIQYQHYDSSCWNMCISIFYIILILPATAEIKVKLSFCFLFCVLADYTASRPVILGNGIKYACSVFMEHFRE